MASRPTRTLAEPISAGGPCDPLRREFLDRHATATGLHWSIAIRAGLKRQGRPAAGGFPGTLSEARARLAQTLGDALRAERMSPLLQDERDWSARIAYAAARRDWLAHGEPAADDEAAEGDEDERD